MTAQNDACTSSGLVKHLYFNWMSLVFTLEKRKEGGLGGCLQSGVQWPDGRESISQCVLCAELRYL